MSVSDKEISSASGVVVVNDTKDAEGGRNQRRKKKKKKFFGFGGFVSFIRGKKFRKFRKRRSICFRDKSSRGDRYTPTCFFCIGTPKTTESSSIDSPTSDPNDPMFTHDMVRVFLEKNDFYSKECNTHLDIGSLRLSD